MESLPQFVMMVVLVVASLGRTASATVFTLSNKCSHTVWPGSLAANVAATIGGGGFVLPPGESVALTVSPGWSGRFWARTGCKFDASGNGNCMTGDCGRLACASSGGAPPVTLAEFTIGSPMDFYDVSLVDGYNIGVGVQAIGGSGDCQYAGCLADLRKTCPSELQIQQMGEVVACKSACLTFNTPEYCCTGDHSTPATCPPTHYSAMFKNACPRAYSYAYDDASSICTCSGADYAITFCPKGV